MERDTPGLTVCKPEDKLGIKASGTCMIHFENVRVSKKHILYKKYDQMILYFQQQLTRFLKITY